MPMRAGLTSGLNYRELASERRRNMRHTNVSARYSTHDRVRQTLGQDVRLPSQPGQPFGQLVLIVGRRP
jgi:hypothetical protein